MLILHFIDLDYRQSFKALSFGVFDFNLTSDTSSAHKELQCTVRIQTPNQQSFSHTSLWKKIQYLIDNDNTSHSMMVKDLRRFPVLAVPRLERITFYSLNTPQIHCTEAFQFYKCHEHVLKAPENVLR